MPISIGGIPRALVEKKRAAKEGADAGTIGAAGVIAGEALMGIILAGLIVGGASIQPPFSSDVLGFILSVLVMAWLFRTSFKRIVE